MYYSNLGAVAQEAIALNQLYKTSSLEMKYRCMDRECKTVSETYEAVTGDNNARKSSVTCVNGLNDQSEKGVIDTRREYDALQVVNKNDSDVNIYPNMKLGSCESVDIEKGQNRDVLQLLRTMQLMLQTRWLGIWKNCCKDVLNP
ncbi:hypothetical protein CHS0354_000852 [Potamilus streckersoni]|uniref:Uncharacterized protein n=1 Tax=Potamilus streckersoni TaxID=2493646 RepID=A0AAE0VKE4_9BIVA|nr:hypothetical protein CHS0354_000852 [Potamilus streckersoni]